jgi:hypothetical protein
VCSVLAVCLFVSIYHMQTSYTYRKKKTAYVFVAVTPFNNFDAFR